jgi:hypothetical protein
MTFRASSAGGGGEKLNPPPPLAGRAPPPPPPPPAGLRPERIVAYLDYLLAYVEHKHLSDPAA